MGSILTISRFLNSFFESKYLKKAINQFAIHDWEECEESLKKVFKKNPKNIIALYIMGLLLDKTKQKPKAKAHYYQVIR